MSEETITIPKELYNDLIKRDLELSYLESMGVDNWDGCDYAYEEFYKDHPEYLDK